MGIFQRIFNKEQKEDLDKGLEKTKSGFLSKLSKAVAGKSRVDEETLDQVEEALMTADVGLDTTVRIIEQLEERVARDKFINSAELNSMLESVIVELLRDNKSAGSGDFNADSPNKPHVIMVVGVNGVGKTTTIGKLSHMYKQAGKSVVLGAADTFRAAAIDQLGIWADRVGVPIVKKEMGSDPASVTFDTLKSAVANNADLVLIDTAGRLHNKVGLMNELSKIRNVMDKVVPGAPHEVMLVLDASTGQNALEQAKQFTAATDVSCMTLTKLDGTAKGGVVLGIAEQFSIPVKYIGVGEGIDQLQVFDSEAFVHSLFES